MSYHGNITLGATLDFKFTSIDAGIPTQLAGSPVISAYPDNSTTQLTAGITLTVDFDSLVGLNHVRVVATSGNGYITGTNYDLVITTGTVGSKSVIGYVVGSFSIEARSTNLVGDLSTTMKTSVKTQITDALNVDTYAEPGQEAPPATTTLVKRISYLYKMLRNRLTQTATTLSVYADDAITVDQKATVSDSGITYDRGEIGSGP